MAAAAVAFVLVMLCHTWRLGSAPLSGTEGHRALPAMGMATSGDWIVPRFYNEPYLRKPPAQYWAQAITMKLLGAPGEWVWRLPSVIGAALCAALMALVAGYWFGRIAAWTAGLGFITLIALWPGSRSADIDSLHILASAAAALCFVQLGFGLAQHRLAWSIAAALALAASVMLKGHAGLSIVLGVILGGSILHRQWKWLLRPSTWGPFVFAAATLAAWVIAVRIQLAKEGGQADWSGVNEAAVTMWNVKKIAQAFAVPPQLWAFALPLAASVVALRPMLRPRPEEVPPLEALGRGKIVLALIAGIVTAWIILLLNGVTNPRYGYVMMPLWAVLGGAVAQAWHDGHIDAATQKLLRMIGTVAAAGAAIASVVVGVMLARQGGASMAVAASGAAMVAGITAVIAWAQQRVGRAAITTVAVFALTTVALAEMKHIERRASSGIHGAKIIAERVPPGRLITTLYMPRVKPEILLYAGHPVTVLVGAQRTAQPLPPDTWVLFTSAEWKRWEPVLAGAVESVTEIPAGKHPGYLVHTHPPRTVAMQ